MLMVIATLHDSGRIFLFFSIVDLNVSARRGEEEGGWNWASRQVSFKSAVARWVLEIQF